MTTRPELRFAEIGLDETAELFQFYLSTLPHAERIRTLYQWRLAGTDADVGIRTVVARDESEIVGALSMVPFQLGQRGARIEAAWQYDTVVAPRQRGRGIARQLVDISAADFPLVAAKGTQPVMYGLRKRMGFEDVPRSTYLLLALSPLSRSGSLRKRLAIPFFFIGSLARRAARSSSSLRTRVVPAFDRDFEALCQTIGQGEESTPVKTRDYLNWRYTRCPDRSYMIVRAEDHTGSLRGGAVIRPNPGAYQDGWLVDMIVDVQDQEGQRALLDACIRELRRSKASCVRTFSTSPGIRRVLVERGFLDTGITPRFTFRAATPLGSFQPETWNFWHGDGDTELHD
jgi:GNAT superfamily N-acetyltransferase